MSLSSVLLVRLYSVCASWEMSRGGDCGSDLRRLALSVRRGACVTWCGSAKTGLE